MSYRVFVGIFFVTVVIIGHWWYVLVWHALFLNSNYLHVHFLNVGQGDAVLIETPNNRQVLVDAGRGIKILNALDAVLPAHDRDIDVAVMTHPDADHIGGFVPVLNQYEVGTVIQSFIPSNTTLYKTVVKAVENEKSSVYTISQVYSFSLDGVRFDVLWPIGTAVKEINAASVVLLVTHGDIEILLTGDAPSAVEDFLVETFPEYLEDIEILKAGHHGSKTSTSQKFLIHTKPNVIVYSTGKNNSYGHPHTAVKDRVANYSAAHPEENLKSHTTESGTVSFCVTKKQFALCN